MLIPTLPLALVKDKVEEFRKILNQRKAMEDIKRSESVHDQTQEIPPQMEDFADDSQDTVIDWQQQYETLVAENATQKEDALRRLAEVENTRKRLIKEHEDTLKFANERLLKDLIPVLDNLEMSLTHISADEGQNPLAQGVQLTLKLFLQTLEKTGLREVGATGESFDPNLHEAIGISEGSDMAPNHVAQVHRKGYSLNGRLIRAAMVTVTPE
jgi:molecular chaperone GrpE